MSCFTDPIQHRAWWDELMASQEHDWCQCNCLPLEKDGKYYSLFYCWKCETEFLSFEPDYLQPSVGSCINRPKKYEWKEPKQVGKSRIETSGKEVEQHIFELQRKLTRYDYLYYVLFRSEVSDQEYDIMYMELTKLLKEHPEIKLPYAITRSWEMESSYPQWVREELGVKNSKTFF